MVPLSWLLDEFPEPERPAALARERSLFHVACSRPVTNSSSTGRILPARCCPDRGSVRFGQAPTMAPP